LFVCDPPSQRRGRTVALYDGHCAIEPSASSRLESHVLKQAIRSESE